MSQAPGHPSRFLFDSNGVPGLLSQLITGEHALNPRIIVDVDWVKAAFARAGCPNAVFLIDRCYRNPELKEFGSGSIDLDDVTSEEFSLENALRLQELYFGNPRHGITPLQWFAYLARRIDEVPEEHRPTFDLVCAAFVDFDRAGEGSNPMN